MSAVEALRSVLPDVAKDTKLNLQSVLQPGEPLSTAQRWGIAVASSITARNPALRDAVIRDARIEVEPAVIEDAMAAASLMAMNNVYYRFRHMIGSPTYAEKPARLRMNRLVKTAGPKVDFELMCLAVSAINACETCVRAHEKTVIEGGLTPDHVHEAVRIAATIMAAAVSLEIAHASVTA